MHPLSSNLNRAAPTGCQSDADRPALRCGSLLRFDARQGAFEADPLGSLQWDDMLSGSSRIRALDALQLRRPSQAIVDGSQALSLTYVLRHSAGALMWRNGWGESSRLEPGAIFVNQGRHDSQVEIAPADPDEPCDCLRLVLQRDFACEIALRLETPDLPLRNSPQACVRVVLGGFRGHRAQAIPLPLMSLLDIELVPTGVLDMPTHPDEWSLAILTAGTLQWQDQVVEPLAAIAFFGREPLARVLSPTGASLLWLSLPYRHGTPRAEP